MHRSSILGSRIAISVAVAVGLLLAEVATFHGGYSTANTVYAIPATPSPSVTSIGLTGQMTPTPTLVAAPGAAVATPTAPPNGVAPAVSNPAAATGPFSLLQQASDQITAVSQQVTQVVQDPSLSIDAKVQRINALAAQFNQLVAQWQQQLSQIQPSTAGATAPPCGTTACAQPPLPSVSGVQPTPTVPAAAPGGATVDQLRAQIASVSQQMAQVSVDPSLTADAKTAQLSQLGAQFNQLMAQLKQLGG